MEEGMEAAARAWEGRTGEAREAAIWEGRAEGGRVTMAVAEAAGVPLVAVHQVGTAPWAPWEAGKRVAERPAATEATEAVQQGAARVTSAVSARRKRRRCTVVPPR